MLISVDASVTVDNRNSWMCTEFVFS